MTGSPYTALVISSLGMLKQGILKNGFVIISCYIKHRDSYITWVGGKFSILLFFLQNNSSLASLTDFRTLLLSYKRTVNHSRSEKNSQEALTSPNAFSPIWRKTAFKCENAFEVFHADLLVFPKNVDVVSHPVNA